MDPAAPPIAWAPKADGSGNTAPGAFTMTFGRRETLASRLATSPSRAGNGTRTRDPNLGKVVLYQLSYSRMQT